LFHAWDKSPAGHPEHALLALDAPLNRSMTEAFEEHRTKISQASLQMFKNNPELSAIYLYGSHFFEARPQELMRSPVMAVQRHADHVGL
jgi:hypothetical protein